MVLFALTTGTYTFTSIRMGGDTKIVGERGSVETRAGVANAEAVTGINIRIVNYPADGRRSEDRDRDGTMLKPRTFTIAVAGSDPMSIVDPAYGPSKELGLTPTTVVSMDHKVARSTACSLHLTARFGWRNIPA